MIEIDRSWRIGCETGDQANEVWRVLKDAGEPMFRNKGSYGVSDFQVFSFISGYYWGVWEINKDFANITFKEFMKLMKSEGKKEEVQYVDNLLDYLDKPELIQHKDGANIRALHYFPYNNTCAQVLVVQENGSINRYGSDGKYLSSNATSSFILKPKEKKIVRGWRRKLIFKCGAISDIANAQATKEEFMDIWKNTAGIEGFGPWEEVITEVFDD